MGKEGFVLFALCAKTLGEIVRRQSVWLRVKPKAAN
jgi:hypothetical protein